jgi:hypothetical protein
VRQSWEWLAGCSVVSIVGISWLLIRFGAPASAWASIEILGMVLCAIVAVAATVKRTTKKWPAGVALVCAAPVAQNILLGFPSTMELMLHLGVPFLLFLAGAIGAVATSIKILVMKPPVPPSDEIVARARVVR